MSKQPVELAGGRRLGVLQASAVIRLPSVLGPDRQLHSPMGRRRLAGERRAEEADAAARARAQSLLEAKQNNSQPAPFGSANNSCPARRRAGREEECWIEAPVSQRAHAVGRVRRHTKDKAAAAVRYHHSARSLRLPCESYKE